MKFLRQAADGRWHMVLETRRDDFGAEYVLRSVDIHDDLQAFVTVREPDVLACGPTPEACIQAFATSRGWGTAQKFTILDCGEPGMTWGRRFTATDAGTGFKAAGHEVPGGFVLTWWK